MNRALFYLWIALLRRQSLAFAASLRRPTSLLGVLAVVSLVGFFFYFRQHRLMAEAVRRESLVGAGLVMFCGSLFKGFLQRGLLCEPADVEFLFTGPFTQRQIVLYRLLPNYLFAVLQGLVFLALFASHLHHPGLVTICLILFQLVCFHVATYAALFAGTISDLAHYRVRWVMLAAFFTLGALYLRLAWDFKIVPIFCSSPLFQALFYPAVIPADLANAVPFHQWALGLEISSVARQISTNLLYLAGFGLAACASLRWLLRNPGEVLEPALAATTRIADKRHRIQHGRPSSSAFHSTLNSLPLPRSRLFRGVGAILWRNLVAVRRSRREMLLAAVFTLVYSGLLTALMWIYHDLAKKAGGAPLYEARGFTTGIALFVGMLAFFLQRMFPFDFRRDGQHLLNFRTLPVSPLGLTLAQIAVPTTLCLAAQACGVIPLIIFGSFDWLTLVLVVLGYPAVSLALNAVWNFYYLLAAARGSNGRFASNSAVGTLMVVALSFLVFYPAGWVGIKMANYYLENQTFGFMFAAAAGLGVQYVVDLVLLLGVATLFHKLELAQES